MLLRIAALTGLLALTACSGGAGGALSNGPLPSPTPTINPQANLYQPLAAGDAWTYTCEDIKGGGENGGAPFTIAHTVLGTTTVGGRNVYELSLQIPQVPSAPLRIATEIQLLANDTLGNLTLYGYLVGGAVQPITPTLFVTATPPPGFPIHVPFNYPGPNGTTIDRFFIGLEPSNPTPLGTFQPVAPYFESGSTHNYGYSRGTGIVEEDHGPNFEVDCLISSVTLH